ncbi:MAG: T9SS type A sorting domain-containing protein [Flavobacteriales bacterium]|nr:T9SS type A sorting domain-containing protein [Flavobacteriales bacterium]
MRATAFSAVLLFTLSASAQPFSVGTRQLSFVDAARNRTIEVIAHYPAASSGTDVPVADGEFPVLVFGHGFVMAVDVYSNLWNYFVPKGYIMLLPTTEGGIPPDHGAFGADLAYLADAMQLENTNASSGFFGHVLPATALMGHSMGGGASFLGAGGNTNIQALVNFAAAETTPSAVAAAATVQVPTLVFAASEDCVAPIAAHQGPMYAALTVPCKAFVNILGGGHCYFAENSFTCTLGEFTCGPDLTVSRTEQHAIMNDFAGLWLDHFLKGDELAYAAVLDSMTTSTRVDAEFTCLSTAVNERKSAQWSLYPTVASDRLIITDPPIGATVHVTDATGRLVLPARILNSSNMIAVGSLREGLYHLVMVTGNGTRTKPFVVGR